MDQVMTDFDTSASTEKLDAALAKAQGSFHVAAKGKVNPHFRTKYANLEAVWDACREALSINGISVTQWPVHSTDGRVHLITRLASAGEWMRGHFSIPCQKADAHGYGSAITYLKRYSLAAVLGIADGEDDDGNAAVNGQSKHIPFRGDPIREAKESVATDDPHLLVNGETRSAYEVNKEKNGGKTPYQLNKEADEWVSKAKAAIAGMTSELEISEWWDERMKDGGSLDRLKKAHPKKFTDLWSVAEERIAQVQRVPRDRNVMEAG